MHDHGPTAVTGRPGVSLHGSRIPDPAPGTAIMKGRCSARQAIEMAQDDTAMRVVMRAHGATA